MGGEYTVGIIGSGDDMVALPIIKIEPATEFYDYEAKYNRDDTRYLCPCGLPEAQGAGEIRKGRWKPSASSVAAAGGGSIF
jgi:D-alanine-D-alanine ligase